MTPTSTYFLKILFLLLCFVLCISLIGCEDYDSMVFDFYTDTRDGAFNAIILDFGENNSGIYFIDERYGIWSNGEEKYLFDFDYVPRTQRGGELMIMMATERSYYQSVVQNDNGRGAFYYGRLVFSGSCEFSDDATVATISPDRIGINEMSIDSDQTVTMTKTKLLPDDIIPFDVAIHDMHFVPDTYYAFLSNPRDAKFSCEIANIWIDGSTMTGEWSTNGSIVPIRMQTHEKVPYIEIFDISGSSEKPILKSYVKAVSKSSVELIDPDGVVFYTVPSTPVHVTKTN